jgi:8-oxo-dGTP pyrophosphatase MutT (NUDIX family)
MKQGVSIVVLGLTEDFETKVLICERKDGSGYCLPGGKIDPGERGEQAAMRELFEETGIYLSAANTRHLYSGVEIPEWITTTFYLPYKLKIADTILSPGEGEPPCKWGTWEELFGPPFGDYNRKVFEVMRT